MIIMAMKTLKTECFGQIWSNLAKFEAIIEAGRVKRPISLAVYLVKILWHCVPLR